MAAGGLVTFCLDTKSNQKNQVIRKASLPHGAFALQTGQNQGWNLFAPLRSHIARASAKISYALQPHSPPCFARFHPKLTG
jgi:hypothetical protein